MSLDDLADFYELIFLLNAGLICPDVGNKAAEYGTDEKGRDDVSPCRVDEDVLIHCTFPVTKFLALLSVMANLPVD